MLQVDCRARLQELERLKEFFFRSHIRADAQQIKSWLSAGRDVYIYYNNDIHGHAIANANELLEMLA